MACCNFCGSQSARPLHRLRDWRLSLPGDFMLVQCQVCALMYLDPRPTWSELLEHYPDEYTPYSGRLSSSSIYRRWSEHHGLQRRCRAIARFQPTGRLLDVGCATGKFLNEARQHGAWQPIGVEPVAAPASFAREHFGLDVVTGTLEEARFASSAFDVITFWDVLEHVEDPRGTLEEACRILKPGGWLVVQVPDPNSWQARYLGKHWAGFDAPRHLYGFPQDTLRRQLLRLGFDSVTTQALEGGTSIFWRSVGAKLRDENPQSPFARYVDSALLHRLSAPVFALLRSVGFGASTTCFARKAL